MRRSIDVLSSFVFTLLTIVSVSTNFRALMEEFHLEFDQQSNYEHLDMQRLAIGVVRSILKSQEKVLRCGSFRVPHDWCDWQMATLSVVTWKQLTIIHQTSGSNKKKTKQPYMWGLTLNLQCCHRSIVTCHRLTIGPIAWIAVFKVFRLIQAKRRTDDEHGRIVGWIQWLRKSGAHQ
jgi:hypothetical protein